MLRQNKYFVNMEGKLNFLVLFIIPILYLTSCTSLTLNIFTAKQSHFPSTLIHRHPHTVQSNDLVGVVEKHESCTPAYLMPHKSTIMAEHWLLSALFHIRGQEWAHLAVWQIAPECILQNHIAYTKIKYKHGPWRQVAKCTSSSVLHKCL